MELEMKAIPMTEEDIRQLSCSGHESVILKYTDFTLQLCCKHCGKPMSDRVDYSVTNPTKNW